MAWGVYKNGNSIVKINLMNGTKIRETKDDDFDLEFPENIDLNIGNRCDGGCQYCYINATPNGADGELLNNKFIDTLHPYTECAINGNSIDHPQLIPFLEKLKRKHIIANITVNQIHFERKQAIIRDLVNKGLVKGIGISLRKPTKKFIKMVQRYPNAVIHTIVGVLTQNDIEKLRDNDLKLLILGYKDKGRGIDYKAEHLIEYTINKDYLYDNLHTLPDLFKVVSFDNLALDQLDVKRILTPEEWETFYLGDEGTASMYIDLVTKKFGISSLCKEEEMMPIMDDIKDMFAVIKTKSKKEIKN